MLALNKDRWCARADDGLTWRSTRLTVGLREWRPHRQLGVADSEGHFHPGQLCIDLSQKDDAPPQNQAVRPLRASICGIVVMTKTCHGPVRRAASALIHHAQQSQRQTFRTRRGGVPIRP